jgi:two-component system cell cycle sensor histidine kinase/response regulator CckA
VSSVRPTVLAVDDEEAVRALIARTLAAEGYSVLTAGNGEEALVLARPLAGQLALVITDLQMPQMGGTTLAVHLARMTPAPRVLLSRATESCPMMRCQSHF